MERRQSIMTRRYRRHLLGIEGAAAVEFAITISLLAVLVLGVADYGILMNDAAGLVGASRAGAEYAIANPTDTTGTETQTCGFFGYTLGSCAPVTPNATLFCTCVDGTWPSGNSCPPSSNPCTTAKNPYISGNPADSRVLEYVTVTAQQNFSPLFNVINLGVIAPTTFSFPSSLSGTTVARAQ